MTLLPHLKPLSMKPSKSPSTIVAIASLAIGFVLPAAAFAFAVTPAHGHSTFNAVSQWAAEVGYAVIWQPRTSNGMVDFTAPSREVPGEFYEAVSALVSGAAYGRANVYCVPPSEFRAQAIVDDRMHLIYVVGQPTGRRCVVPYP